MYKLLILLTLSSVSFANCNYKLEVTAADGRIAEHLLDLTDLAVADLTNKNFNLVDDSLNTILINISPDSYSNRKKVKSVLYRRVNGALINYSYGEGRSYRSEDRSLSKNNIVLSLSKSIKQLPKCHDD